VYITYFGSSDSNRPGKTKIGDTMKNHSIQIAGKTCTIYESEMSEYMLVQPIDGHDLKVLSNEVQTIQSLTGKPFTLVAFEVMDWQSELTPWSAPAAFGEIPFGDGAEVTLSFIIEQLLPQLEQLQLFDKHKMQCLLGGYSLAGLFALWAGYQTTIFEGIAAASPSVWYQGWIKYAESHQPKASSVYLSLGDKENKTKNPLMAQVADCIRKQHDLLETHGIATLLEWNSGNHFKDSDIRTAKGFAWLINR
jgi:predicted alpha/beta superfamily hydrolase